MRKTSIGARIGRVRGTVERVGGKDVWRPKITEKVFQAQVKQAAIITGWKYYATWNSFRSTEGFPDCVMIHPKKGRLLVVELKSETGQLTEKQAEWLDDFRAAGVEVHMWRPSDFDVAWKILNGEKNKKD